ncbi:MAG: DUF2231 domain-containing protein [Epsilonproteobacteria bacterium]|nr:DUF2231 domain-containing protein [Campylobacterota bacterium]OIO14101.1 MAG: hypothetical protein AUJ81_10035 [Helicobacteraceae bacterium CG1_02_36_14]PIP09716.1 MAG: hypothetical protein COX50_10110 [Sulfurimonas sp. CG23_combo_of_CG06-09_8_20_14_all_36_33]PIS26261.1 MAG: hypothetical protein COT46_03780 [Sulfurimonas sp. CG08_land_8_20_14_0_20_36_33]PIU34345.1 MAG: hypothetical protein COT05_08570 [Sulfurimonas sp. CG07_land_8_20_14_0_80_36_56]PIV02643.1 MAG: hypothetical protein COS56_
MLHPVVSHFAVSLPILSFVLGVAYLIKPSELMSKISTRFMVFATLFLVFAFFTGKSDGGEAYILLPTEGQELLKEHKAFGLYLLIAMVIATLFKFFGCFKKVLKAEIFAIVIVAIISGGVMYQGKMGGELTYTYGTNVKNHSDGLDCLEDPSEFLEEKE